MAQASMASAPPGPAHKLALAASDADQIREYQRIVEFRDTVVSGKHPRIHVPAPSVPKPGLSSKASTHTAREQPAPSAAGSLRGGKTGKAGKAVVNGYQAGNMQSFKTNAQQAAVNVASTASAPAVAIPGMSTLGGAGRAEINPILLEKSDDLVKAEIQLQRQRLEKAVREQLDQRKAAAKAALQPSEQLPDLDLPDILAKALTLVQATAPPPTADAPAAANANDSDSFDDNTFYSSQHDTPESHKSYRGHNASEDVQMLDTSPAARPTNAHKPLPQISAPHAMPPSTTPSYRADNGGRNAYMNQNASIPSHLATGTGPASAASTAPGRQRWGMEAQVISSDSGAASRSDKSGGTDSDQPTDLSRSQNNSAHFSAGSGFMQREPPLVRAHNLEPFAPQPAHVSPLATGRQPQIPEPAANAFQAAPAQVAALRQEHVTITSPESSPQGDKGSKKKNKKRNKKKADGRAQEAPGSPDIKPEPRSPSPLSAPQFERPPKRVRPSDREPDVVYGDPRFERPVSQLHYGRYSVAPMQTERVPLGYDRADDPYARQVRYSVAPVSQRPEPIYEERRPDGTIVQYIRRPPSPQSFAVPHGEPRPARAASYSVANPTYRQLPPYDREGRTSVRPYADRARSRSPILVESRSPVMAPPAPPLARIIVDEYGREYIEPPRTANVSRRSVIPQAGQGEREVFYDRAPLRAPSRMQGPETFEENGVIYRVASPAHTPRRVITQPEYSTGFRSYRERDYPAQSMGPPSQDFVQLRGAAEYRVPEQLPREYLSRAASVRPAEPVPYYERVHSVRPDMAHRQYATEIQAETGREPVSRDFREFSSRPGEQEMARRGYSVRPVERSYYDPSPRGEAEMPYIERPQTVQEEIVYADGSRRQMY
ncbi:hypothetical protein GGR56DRAFT_631931 [Xylariaceae sp. FL0804]|nr:hypothetical protein GGR56DRAFT_631931 [Xylariaceae sp. FL0804]